MNMEMIQINNQICAIQTIPKYSSRNILPTVLMFHGFGTDKDKVGSNTFTTLSEKLYNAGIASLRIDFRGHGNSVGSTKDMTIDSLLDDASIVYYYLISQDFVDKNRLGVCGFSLGAVFMFNCINCKYTYNILT